MSIWILFIHPADPKTRPIVVTISSHVRPHFSKSRHTKQIKEKIVIAAGGIVVLAEGIIDVWLIHEADHSPGR